LIKNIRILPELSNAEAKIALMLGIVFEYRKKGDNRAEGKRDYINISIILPKPLHF